MNEAYHPVSLELGSLRPVGTPAASPGELSQVPPPQQGPTACHAQNFLPLTERGGLTPVVGGQCPSSPTEP